MRDSAPISELPKVLRFWRDLEFFLPFQLNDVLERYPEAIIVSKGEQKPLPWEDGALYDLSPDKEYSFDVFLAPFALEEVLLVLSRIVPGVGKAELPDPRRFEGASCFLRTAVNQNGKPNPDDLSISTLPWALARFERTDHLSLIEFDLFANSITQSFQDLANSENQRQITREDLENLTLSLSEGHPLTFFPNDQVAVIVPIVTGKRRVRVDTDFESPEEDVVEVPQSDARNKLRDKRKVDILNSFYLRDLERIHQGLSDKQELPEAFARYFSGLPNSSDRIDTLNDSSKHLMLKYFKPETITDGRWPALVVQSLGFQQQLVVNYYFHSDSPLTAVNGPPGTGKTTLVREILAELVVRRARQIAKLTKPEEALEPHLTHGEIGRKTFKYRALKPQFTGLELVVASSNNAAVENISLGLPDRQSIAEEFADVTYLRATAQLLSLVRGESAKGSSHKAAECNMWGLPTVPLGNAINRRRFRRAAF